MAHLCGKRYPSGMPTQAVVTKPPTSEQERAYALYQEHASWRVVGEIEKITRQAATQRAKAYSVATDSVWPPDTGRAAPVELDAAKLYTERRATGKPWAELAKAQDKRATGAMASRATKVYAESTGRKWPIKVERAKSEEWERLGQRTYSLYLVEGTWEKVGILEDITPIAAHRRARKWAAHAKRPWPPVKES